jgi:RNA polymerase sigma-70 factor (ECF subfamily)
MLGSLQDAEDALQETLLRAWRGLGGFESGRSLRRGSTGSRRTSASTRSRSARSACCHLDEPAWRPADGPARRWLESIWIDPYPDEHLGLEDGYAAPEARYEQRESVELAFIVALQHLPARQRAVLILREVLGFSAREVAQALDTTRPRSTARCSAPGRPWTRRCPSGRSRRRSARWATTACAGSSSATSTRGRPATSMR